jgi:hypothetical protein
MRSDTPFRAASATLLTFPTTSPAADLAPSNVSPCLRASSEAASITLVVSVVAFSTCELSDDAYCSRRLGGVAPFSTADTSQRPRRSIVGKLVSVWTTTCAEGAAWRESFLIVKSVLASETFFQKADAYRLGGVGLDSGGRRLL